MTAALRVMTYNIRHGLGTDGRVDLARIGDVIAAARADVVALQEVDIARPRSGRVDQARELAARFDMHAQFGGGDMGGAERYGIATLSRWPIDRTEIVDLPHGPSSERRRALITRLRRPADGRGLEVVNTHLSTRRRERAIQADGVVRALGTGDLLVAGDLNCFVGSTPYRSLCACKLTAAARGRTWPAQLPMVQLDHLLFRGALRLVWSGAWNAGPARRASDHLPLVAELQLVENA